MRYTPNAKQAVAAEMLDPRSVLRWVWLGRIVLACAILVAAVLVWNEAEPRDTLIATLSFAVAMLATAGSAMYAEVQQRSPGAAFHATQCAIDLGLVTAIVHVTGGWSSQFAALYILVIASAALILPFRLGLGVAGIACLLYAVDVLWLRGGMPHVGVAVQLGVFVVVALGSGYVAARLRQAGVGREALAAQLARVQLEAADILSTIRSGIVTVDADGQLQYANPAASELLGVNLDAFMGMPVLASLRGIAPQLASLLEQSSRDGCRTSRAEGIIRRAHETVEIGVTTTTAKSARPDGRTSATAIFQDISDSKRLQALHVRAERLEAVAELSASLAHEIRNPLASIRSATEQLARRRAAIAPFREDDDERVLHGLVVREADRLSRLLGDFLDFARARVTRVAAIDVGAVVRAASTVAASHPDRAASTTVVVSVEPGLPALDGDEDLLHRAVFNLVLNAVQATGADGHVVVDVRRSVSPDHTAPPALREHGGGVLVISVTDNGPGIPSELRERLFEPFVSGKTGGTGLGLPVVHRAVEAHHGVVLVDRLADHTCFSIHLPIVAAGDAATADAASADTASSDGDINVFPMSSRLIGAVR